MGQVPDVPQLVLKAVRGHQIENEQVPIAPVHQEPDGLEMLFQKRVQIGEHDRLVAAIMDRRRPGLIGADLLFELGEDRRGRWRNQAHRPG